MSQGLGDNGKIKTMMNTKSHFITNKEQKRSSTTVHRPCVNIIFVLKLQYNVA